MPLIFILGMFNNAFAPSISLLFTTFDISSNVSWTLTDNANWLTVSPESGSASRAIVASYSEKGPIQFNIKNEDICSTYELEIGYSNENGYEYKKAKHDCPKCCGSTQQQSP